MADTYEAFYNGKPLNPNRGLPTMTYAQAEDCGLTESERLWCRTDGEDTPITAEDIPYSTGVSVKDKIDDMLGGIVQYKDYTLSQALTIGAGEAKVASLTENIPLTAISTVIWNYNTSGFDNLIPTLNKWYGAIRIMIKNTGSTSVTIPVTVSIRVYYI